MGSAHVGTAHVGSAHVGTAHVGSAHVGSAHVGRNFFKKRVLENGQSLIPKPWAIPNSGACLELIYESGPPP